MVVEAQGKVTQATFRGQEVLLIVSLASKTCNEHLGQKENDLKSLIKVVELGGGGVIYGCFQK